MDVAKETGTVSFFRKSNTADYIEAAKRKSEGGGKVYHNVKPKSHSPPPEKSNHKAENHGRGCPPFTSTQMQKHTQTIQTDTTSAHKPHNQSTVAKRSEKKHKTNVFGKFKVKVEQSTKKQKGRKKYPTAPVHPRPAVFSESVHMQFLVVVVNPNAGTTDEQPNSSIGEQTRLQQETRIPPTFHTQVFRYRRRQKC